MNRKVCDICGLDIPTNMADSDGYHLSFYQKTGKTLDRKVLCDKKAKINMTILANYIGHSTGYGGSPELCHDCFVSCVEDLLEHLKSYAPSL